MTLLPTDARLARRATDGDERAFAAIFRRYHQELYRFCLSIVSRPEDAQDALQNTMLKALRALPGEERQIELKAWLYRVAHNESIELLRKRREHVEIDAERLTTVGEPAETAALRERLRHLFDDLELLPERQRGALVMRELGGLGFEQIGEAFATSAAVARQTVYEARLNLRQLETGREMSCERVTRQLSEADGRVTRRRDVQAHLRACQECREFRDAIASRRHDMAALAPLPAVAAGSILQGLLGGGTAGGGLAGATAGSVGAGAGKVAATSALVKSVAAVAVVATIGVTAADRGGLIDAGLPGGKATKQGAAKVGSEPDGAAAEPARGDERQKRGRATVHRAAAAGALRRRAPAAGIAPLSARSRVARPNASQTAGSGPEPSGGDSRELPAASQHGQETAAAHQADHVPDTEKAHGHAPVSGPHSSHGAAHGHKGATGAEHQAKGHGKHGSSGSHGSGNASPAVPPAGSTGKKATSEPEAEEPQVTTAEPGSPTDGQDQQASP